MSTLFLGILPGLDCEVVCALGLIIDDGVGAYANRLVPSVNEHDEVIDEVNVDKADSAPNEDP